MRTPEPNFGWHLPPGVTDRDIDPETVEEADERERKDIEAAERKADEDREDGLI